MPNAELHNYFRSQQISLQWLPFLRALAAELTASADANGLRLLFFKIGERLGQEVEQRFAQVQTLPELEDELNAFWAQINWGWVNVAEGQGQIDISHQAAPLAEAFGDESLAWSVGLLEGFYQTVFRVLGAGESMQVQAVDDACSDMLIQLRFGSN